MAGREGGRMSIRKRRRKSNGESVADTAYTVYFSDPMQIRRALPAFTDKAASEELERNVKRLVSFRQSRLTLDAELIRFLEDCRPDIRDRLAEWNIIDSQRAASGKRLSEHIEGWRAALEAKGDTPFHVKQSAARMAKIVKACGWKRLSDITAAGFDDWRNQAKAKGKSVQTVNHYLTVAKTFCGWLVKSRRLTENPLAFLQKKTVLDTERRRIRLASDDSELERLLAATVSGGQYRSMTGPERALLYRLVFETGFRWSECWSLTKASFKLDGNPPCVTVVSGQAKNRKARMNPISAELASDLKEHMALFLPTARAFPRMWKRCGMGAEMLRTDLKAAEFPFSDEYGQIRDFHSLRKTFGTRLCRHGVPLAIAQRLLDHSTPALTANYYTGVMMENKAAAVGKLPVLTGRDAPNVEALAKTGTDDTHLFEPPSLSSMPGNAAKAGREKKEGRRHSRNGNRGGRLGRLVWF
jgi:integrase